MSYVGVDVLNGNVLVLNRSYCPIHVTSVRRGFSLLYQGVAKAVTKNYDAFDFYEWQELSRLREGDSVGTVRGPISIPRVILLLEFDRVPIRHVRFSRNNLMMRDIFQCQYCGRRPKRSELNLDHVIPRSRGGKSTWRNVVTSCVDCNRRKGGRTPREARMRLIRKPARPRWTPFSHFSPSGGPCEDWQPFLNVVNASYWKTELAG